MTEPPVDNPWKRHHAEMDEAVAADKAAARRKDDAADGGRGEYGHPLTVLAGFAAFAILLALCLFIVGRLEHSPLSSDCALARGRGC